MDEPQVPLATFHAYCQDDIDKYAHATNYALILWEIEQKLRSDYKYTELPPDVFRYVERLRDEISSWKIKYHLPE